MTGLWRWPAAAAMATLACAVVFVWRIGPVVLVLTPTHGVHTGDALAAVPALASGFLLRGVLPPGARSGGQRSRTARTATSRMLIAATPTPHHG